MKYKIFILIWFLIQGAYSSDYLIAQTTNMLTYKDSLYINNVLHDSLPGDFYIAFNIKAPDYVGKVLIKPFDLGYFFTKTREKDRPDFKQIMRDVLLRNDTLVTSERIYRKAKNGYKYSFDKVIIDSNVERVAAEGKEAFLNYFFIRSDKQGTFNPERFKGLSEAAKRRLASAVISKLFEWRIYVSDRAYYEEDDVIEQALKVQERFRKVRAGETMIIHKETPSSENDDD